MKTYENTFFPVSKLISKFLSKEAAGSQAAGEINAVGNYSVTPGTFFIKPPAGKIYVINEMTVHIQDNGDFGVAGYGAGTTQLTNGVNIGTAIGSTTSFLTSKPIQSNGEWSAYCGRSELLTWVAGDRGFTATWNFANAGAPVVVDGDLAQLFGAVLSDNLTGLVKHLFHVRGFEVNK